VGIEVATGFGTGGRLAGALLIGRNEEVEEKIELLEAEAEADERRARLAKAVVSTEARA